jgi:hypothetical protein
MMKNSAMRACGKPKRGLYYNIHAKQERIKHGSHEKMRKPGSAGAPTAAAFKQAAKTAHGGRMLLKKGSPAAKAYMSRLRAMRK